MKLTALEIKQQKFDKTLRGYDVGEVNAFLGIMATEWEHMVSKNREMESEIVRLREKLQHYERVESALHETLQTAKDSATQRIDNAKKEARSKIEKAELEAENTIREARQQRQQIRQSVIQLLDRRQEIIRGIKSYLDLANESLSSFSKDESGLYNIPRDGDVEQEHTPTFQKRSVNNSMDESTNLPGLDDVDSIIDDLD